MIAIDPIAQFEKSRDAERKSDLKKVQAAFELFRSDNNRYPRFNTGNGWHYLESGTIESDLNGSVTYLSEIPQGPSSEGVVCGDEDNYVGYVYAHSDGGTSYTIFTNLENENDRDALAAKSPPVDVAGQSSGDGYVTVTLNSGTCSGETFNYWVNNP